MFAEVEASKVLSFDKDKEVMEVFCASNNCETFGFEPHSKTCILSPVSKIIVDLSFATKCLIAAESSDV